MSNLVQDADFFAMIGGPETAAQAALAVGEHGLTEFGRQTVLDASGVYAAAGERMVAYVGKSRHVRKRTNRFTSGGFSPALLLGLVGGHTPLDEDDAACLERILYQAMQAAGWSMRGEYPEGAPRGVERYAQIQGVWASVLPDLRAIAPTLACPWIGADYWRLPDFSHEDYAFETRWRGQSGDVTATLRRLGTRYVVEAGSLIRRDPIASAPALCRVVREEGVYAGALVPEGAFLRLTRDVYRPTLASCSRFVFTSGSSAMWIPHVIDDHRDAPSTRF